MMVRLLGFYHQYKIEDFLSMDISTLSVLISGMGQIIAERQMLLMDAVSYPHIDNKARKSIHKKWSKEACPENFEQRIVKTTDLELF